MSLGDIQSGHTQCDPHYLAVWGSIPYLPEDCYTLTGFCQGQCYI